MSEEKTAEEKKEDFKIVKYEMEITELKNENIMLKNENDELRKEIVEAGATIGKERSRAQRFIDQNSMIKSKLKPVFELRKLIE